MFFRCGPCCWPKTGHISSQKISSITQCLGRKFIVEERAHAGTIAIVGAATINISRVRNLVKQGGHAVPEDKIASRYQCSLDLLMNAIRHTNRAYVFDNSRDNQKHTKLAEISERVELEMKTDQAPAGFKRSFLGKINPPPHE